MPLDLVMTIIGPDRTGLVEAVARAVAAQGGNWLESRMCRLGGEFAGLLRVAIPAERQDALRAALQKLSGDGLQIIVHGSRAAETAGAPMRLEIIGNDRPGIVREITAVLARAGVNVEEFSSEVISAPMSGEKLFKAEARLRLPLHCDANTLKRDLEKIAADLQVDAALAGV